MVISGKEITKVPGAEFEVQSKEADAATGGFRMRSPVRTAAAAASSVSTAERKSSSLKKNASSYGDVFPASSDADGFGDEGMSAFEGMMAEGIGDGGNVSPGVKGKGTGGELSGGVPGDILAEGGGDKRKDGVRKVRQCSVVYGMGFLESWTCWEGRLVYFLTGSVYYEIQNMLGVLLS